MYYCGIDVAKRKHVAIIIDDHGEIVTGAFAVCNDQAGFEGLLAALSKYEGQVSVGLEATGHYWLPLYDTLTQGGY